MKKPTLFAVLFVMVLASVAAILQSGWTSTTNPGVARTALGVPGLTNNNAFTGSNWIRGSFTGNLIGATNYNSSNLVGTVWGGISNPATGGNKMTVLANGNVGIGKTPEFLLDLYKSSTPQFQIEMDAGTAGSANMYFTEGGVQKTYITHFGSGNALANLFSFNNTAGDVRFIDSSGSGFYLKNGNVGIGTTTPTSGKLVVAGSITADTDNTGDIGASGANRYRTAYLGTSVVVPTITLADNPTLITTNAAPAGFVIGVTVPATWFVFTNAGTRFLIPGYTP